MGKEDVTAPRLSVIVPTRNRDDSLRELLASMAAQTYRHFELVIVDDGSSKATAAIVDGVQDIDVRYIATDGVGAVEARCAAVKAARGEILAFTDDDCVVDPRWLAEGVHAIEAGADVAQGRTLPVHEPGPFERSVEHAAGDGLFPTCNVFYLRASYDRAGGFDRFAADRLGFRPGPRSRGLGFGEDTMLGWAVARAGHAVAVPDATVKHAVVRPGVRDLFSRAWMAGAFPSLLSEVPELRKTLMFRRVVLGRPDARLGAYGLLLFLIPGLQLFGLVAAAVWAAARVQSARGRAGSRVSRVVSLPLQLALDATKSAALLVGSVRARVLVL